MASGMHFIVIVMPYGHGMPYGRWSAFYCKCNALWLWNALWRMEWFMTSGIPYGKGNTLR